MPEFGAHGGDNIEADEIAKDPAPVFSGTLPEFCFERQYGRKGRSWNMVHELICRTDTHEYYYFCATHKGKKLIIAKPIGGELDVNTGVYDFSERNAQEATLLFDDKTIGLQVEAYFKKNFLVKFKKGDKGDDDDDSGPVQVIPYFEYYMATSKRYTSKSDEEMKRKLIGYVTKGYNIDPRLVMCYTTDIIKPSMSVLPDRYMPYNDHQIIYTNPGTGKSKIAERTSMLTTRMSAAWMKGFSGAQKADTHVAGLSGMTGAITFDEFQSDDKFVQNLPQIYTLMDGGKDVSLTGHGAPPVDTRFKLRLCGNPGDDKSTNMDYELLMLFNDFLEKSTDNYQAMGRRFAIILFSNDFEKVKTSTMLPAEFEQCFYEWSGVANVLPEKFDELLMKTEVIRFLDKEHDSKFISAIAKYNELMGDSLQVQVFKKPVKSFISELGLNYRRMRGMALKLAVFEHIYSFLESKLTVQELLQDAEKQYQYLVELQVKSMDNLFGVRVGTSEVTDYYKVKLTNLNGAERALVLAIANECAKSEFIPVKLLKIGKYYQNKGTIGTNVLDLSELGLRDLVAKFKPLNIETKIIGGELLVRVTQQVADEIIKVSEFDKLNEGGQNDGTTKINV